MLTMNAMLAILGMMPLLAIPFVLDHYFKPEDGKVLTRRDRVLKRARLEGKFQEFRGEA